MKKDLNEEVKKITKLMKIENNLINENNLLLEGERDDLLLKFFNMLFDVSDTNIDNLVRNSETELLVKKTLKDRADKLIGKNINGSVVTKTDADDLKKIIDDHFDRLVKSPDPQGVKVRLRQIDVPEQLANKAKALFTADEAAVNLIRKTVATSLRNTAEFATHSDSFKDLVFQSLLKTFDAAAKEGKKWMINMDSFKTNYKGWVTKLDKPPIFKNFPELYDEFATNIEKDPDVISFFKGEYNGKNSGVNYENGKFLLKRAPESVFSELTATNVRNLQGLTDEQIAYMNKVYEMKNGVVGNFKLWLENLSNTLKGNKQSYGEKLQLLLQGVESIRKPVAEGGLDLYQKRKIAEQISGYYKELDKLDTAFKSTVEDWINQYLNAPELENLKNILLGSPLEESVEVLTEKSFWPEWSKWIGDAFMQRMKATPDLAIGSLYYGSFGFLTDMVSKVTKRGRISVVTNTIERATQQKTLRGQVWEFIWNGTALNRGDYKSWARYLPMGLEFVGEIANLLFRRNKQQVIKRLTQLGTQYVYSYIYYSILFGIMNILLEWVASYMVEWGVIKKDTENAIGIFILEQAEQYEERMKKILGVQSEDETANINNIKTNESEWQGFWRFIKAAGGSIGDQFMNNFNLLTNFPGAVDDFYRIGSEILKTRGEREAEIIIDREKKLEQQKLIKIENGELITPEEVKKEDSAQQLQKVLLYLGYDLNDYLTGSYVDKNGNTKKSELTESSQNNISKVGFKFYIISMGSGKYVFDTQTGDDPQTKIVMRFKPNSEYGSVEYKLIPMSVWTTPQVWDVMKNESEWKTVPITNKAKESLKNAEEQKKKIENDVENLPRRYGNVNDSIYNKRNKLIMERKTRRIFEEKDEKFGEEKFEHWKKTFEFSSQDPETKEWKRIEKETIESKQVEIEKWVDHYLKSNDEDDAFVRSVIHVFKLDKNPKNHVKKVSFNKGLAHLSENFEVGGLLRVVSVIRESKELEIWSVKYYADGNWELVKGSFNDEELKNVGKTVRERDKKEEERKKPVEGLKKKELTGIQLLNQDEKQGLTELPKQVQRKLLEKLRNGWVTEKPYEFFNEFYSVSNINTIFNEKLKIYKLNPSKEFFNSLVKNSPRIFPRKGICKVLSGVENDENINERTKIVLNHILQKCQTKFKGEYGVKQIKTN